MSEAAAAPSGPVPAVATIPIRADGLDLAREHLPELAAATRAEEGCLAYTVHESGAQPGLFVTVEEWRSAADLEQHLQTPHVARAFEVLGPVLDGEVGIHPLRPLG